MSVYLVALGLGTGAAISLGVRSLGFPFPWEIRNKEYSLEKKVKEIEKAKKEIDIALPKNELNTLLTFEQFSKSLTDAKTRGVKINTFQPNSRKDAHFMIRDYECVFIEEPHSGKEPMYYRSAKSKRLASDYKDLLSSYHSATG